MAEELGRNGAGRLTLPVAFVVIVAAVAGLRFNRNDPAPLTKRDLNLVVQQKGVEVDPNAADPSGPGVVNPMWTHNGTVPGTVLRVRQGDALMNSVSSSMGHSIDFDAAKVAANLYYKRISPGQPFNFELRSDYPGVFMYDRSPHPKTVRTVIVQDMAH